MLGLSRKQVLMAAVILGGSAGVKLDILFANLSFGLFTVSGAALAAAGTWFKGENMARVKVKKLHLGGTSLTVGPNCNPQFPFVFLDRLLLFYQWMIHWSHARLDVQDQTKSIEGEDKAGLSSQWSKKRRDLITKCLKRLNHNKLESKREAKDKLKSELEVILWELSTETTSHSSGENTEKH